CIPNVEKDFVRVEQIVDRHRVKPRLELIKEKVFRHEEKKHRCPCQKKRRPNNPAVSLPPIEAIRAKHQPYGQRKHYHSTGKKIEMEADQKGFDGIQHGDRGRPELAEQDQPQYGKRNWQPKELKKWHVKPRARALRVQ